MSDNLDGSFRFTLHATIDYGSGREERITKDVEFNHCDVTHGDLTDVFKEFLRGVGYFV